MNSEQAIKPFARSLSIAYTFDERDSSSGMDSDCNEKVVVYKW